MEKFKKSIYFVLCFIAIIMAVCSLLSIFRNTESQFLKMLDFPRIQFFVISCLGLVLLTIVIKKWQWYDYLLVLALVGGITVQCSYLIDYTPLVSEAVPSVQAETFSSDDRISILMVNVKMTNRNAKPLLELIAYRNPDLIVAMEVDDWWDRQLQSIETQYPYSQETINSVTYGMTLYSKCRFEDIKVNYLHNQKVPSFESIVELKNGKHVLLYTIHPVPPTHYEDLPDNEGNQEAAMVKLGKKIENATLPVIVAGDFNDVSWGRTNQLTETDGLLHDVRVGRGFYNSYNADNFLVRWPLDHIVVTEEFRLVHLERLSEIGSDHFPIYAELVL